MCKTNRVMNAMFFLLLTVISRSANSQPLPFYSAPPAQELAITTNQTTTLVFPSSIKSVDRGAPSLAAKTIKGITNVLKIKAAFSAFPASNLTVFTADGSIYSFHVTYAQNPEQLLLDFTRHQSAPDSLSPVLFANVSESDLARHVDTVLSFAANRSHPHARVTGGIHLRLTGLYAHDGVAYFRFRMRNRSAVRYEHDFLRCYIEDAHRQKRGVRSEKEVAPLTQRWTCDQQVTANSAATIVIAVKQFTIADNKRFLVEVYEKNGDRRLTVVIKGKDLLKVTNVPY
jgi:conjugative transposon TraN protein